MRMGNVKQSSVDNMTKSQSFVSYPPDGIKLSSYTSHPSPQGMTRVHHCFLDIITCGSYYICRLLGIICFTYNVAEKRAEKSWTTFGYSIGILMTAMLYMPIAMYILYTEMVFLRQNQLLTYVGYIRYGVILMCALATLAMQVFYRTPIVASINGMIHLRREILSNSNVLNSYVIWKILAKCLTLALQFLWLIFLIEKDVPSSSVWFLITLLFVHYCQLVLQMTLNKLYFGLLVVTLIMKQLNHNLFNLLLQLRSLSHHRGGRQHYRMITIHAKLLRLMRYHWMVLKLSGIYVNLYGWQLLSFLTFVIMESVTQIFIMYFVATEIWREFYSSSEDAAATVRGEANDANEMEMHKRAPFLVNPYAILYVFGLLWDMFLIVIMLDELRLQFLHTRYLFSSSIWLKALTSPPNLPLEHCVSSFTKLSNCDVGVCKSIDSTPPPFVYLQLSHFNLYLLHVQPCISYSACGLFTIDKSLILVMLERIFLYLVLLIQFHLLAH